MSGNGKLKLYAVFIFILIFSLTLPSAVCFAAADNGIQMEVSGGYEGIGSVGSCNPFRITIHNSGNDVPGELQIIEKYDHGSRYAYFEQVFISKGSTKVFTINTPVDYLNSTLQINLISGMKVLKSIDYKFIKLVSPDSPLMGILCDDPGGLDSLKGLKLPGNTAAGISAPESGIYSTGNIVDYSARVKKRLGKSKDLPLKTVEFVNLNRDSFPEDKKALRAFDFILVSNFDTSSLTDKQKTALSDWTSEGGLLLVGTGENWEKVCAGLPDALKPFLAQGSINLTETKAVRTFAGVDSPLPPFGIAAGNKTGGQTLIDSNGSPLAIAYKKGSGFVTLMTFAPDTEPLSDWSGIQPLIGKLVKDSISTGEVQNYKELLPITQIKDYRKFIYDLPASQIPLLSVILFAIAIYVVFVGPCAYFLLKWSGKRNLYVAFIIVTAFLFTGVVYMVGMGTHINESVLNSVALINIDDSSRTENISMYMSAFSNRSGTMKIDYDESTDIYPQNSIEADNTGTQPKVDESAFCRYSVGQSPYCEVYGTKIWQSQPIAAFSACALNDNVLNSVSIKNGRINGVIKNPTQFDFEQSFIVYGGRFAYVGNISRGEEKSIDIELDDPSQIVDLKSLLASKYFNGTATGPRSSKEIRRQRDLLKIFYKSYTKNKTGDGKLTFCALNGNTPGCFVKINGKAPEYFNTNIIYTIH